MSRRVIRILLWALVISLMTMIFLFSCQGADDSMATSGRFAGPIAQWIVGIFPQLGFEQVLEVIQLAVRKAAHFSEYLALGSAVCWLMMSYDLRRPRLWGWAAATLYAGTDELHQLLGGERSGMWQDVLLDSAGACMGVLLAVLAAALWRKRKKKAA